MPIPPEGDLRRIPERAPGALDGELIAFSEDLRAEGVAVGTSEILDAFAALQHVDWGDPRAFRETLATTIAKSPEDRRLFDLVFDRFFFRAAEAQAVRMEVSEPQARAGEGQIDLERAPPRDRRGAAGGRRVERCATSRGSRSPRSAAARDPACSGSTCNGSDVRSGCEANPRASCPTDDPRHRRPAPRADPSLRAASAARARAGADRPDGHAPAEAAAQRSRACAAERPGRRPRRRAAGRRPAQTPPRDAGPRAAGPSAPRPRRRAPHDARLAADRRRAGRAALPPASAPTTRDPRPLRRLDQRDEREHVLPQRPARAA